MLASLKIKFAQAIVVGGAIGDVLRPPVRRAMEPFLKKALTEDYHKWIRPGLNYACKLVAVSISTSVKSTRPCWLRRAARSRHRHAIEQASRRWRGGRRGERARKC